MTTPAAPGRRTARTAGGPRERFDLTTVLAVLLPLCAVVAAFAVHANADDDGARAPRETALDRATVICPSGGDTAEVATLTGASGRVAARIGDDQQRVRITPHAPVKIPGKHQALTLTALGALAPRLVAARFATPLAAADCRPPVPDQWFTGVGAGAKHDSLLELVNPDAGRALVDVEVLGRNGIVDAPQLRGIAVSGGQSVRIDLGKTVPRRDDLALHVTTIRGRVSASLADTFDELGGAGKGTDWLAAQSAPSTTNLMLGLPTGTGQRTLVLANPGDSQGSATVRLVSPQSVFTPEGAKPVALPPQSVVRVPLAGLLKGLRSSKRDGPVGLEVDSTVPTTAGLVMFVDGDLAHGVPLPPLTGPGAALLPAGRKQLVLAGATKPGVATVSLWNATGHPLDDIRVPLAAGRGYPVDLPANARLMTLTAARTPISASVLVTGKGVTEIRVREPLTTGLVPQVGPALP